MLWSPDKELSASTDSPWLLPKCIPRNYARKQKGEQNDTALPSIQLWLIFFHESKEGVLLLP